MDKKLIFVVDDDVEIRKLLLDVLEGEDYRVETISDGIKLFERLKTLHPDLILLDLMMSWIDGLDICSSIKKNNAFKDIPVIFITAYKSDEIEKQMQDSLVDDYIFKPFKIEDLFSKIKKNLK